MNRLCVVAALAMLGASPAWGGPVTHFPLNDDPGTPGKGGEIRIVEVGTPGQEAIIQPTGYKLDRDGNRVGKDVPVGPSRKATLDKDGKATFTFAPVYGSSKGTFQIVDYDQQLGDPAILSAAAFEGGIAAPLLGWLVGHGYSGSNPIIQPDFFATDGTPMYVAVDLALLGDMGALFAAGHSFGDIFTLDASDMLPGLPGELFSTTLPVLGSGGWEVTAPPDGTEVVYGGYHATTGDIPEPASWAMMIAGMGLVGATLRTWRVRAAAGAA